MSTKSIAFAAALSITILGGPSVAAAAQRYAAPGGSGTACTVTAPCALGVALNGAAGGDEVIVAPGDYGSAAAPLTTGFEIVDDIDVHGVTGRPRPQLFFSVGDPYLAALYVSAGAATVRHLTIEQSGSEIALWVEGGTAERLTAHASGASACFVGTFLFGAPVFRNAVCRTTAAGAAAVEIDMGGGPPQALALRNVTAYAAGAGTHGLRVASSGGLQLTADVFNSILRGELADVVADANGPTTAATVNVAHSNYDRALETGDGAAAVTDPGTAGNQTRPPLLVNAGTGDFHQQAGSPTVDAGAHDPANGPFDLDGDPRTLGASTDIGADELVPPAPPPPPPAPPPGGTQRGPADVAPPIARTLRLDPPRFRRRTTVRYRLSEPATMRFTVERRAGGRRVRGRCVKPTHGNRGRRACRRYVRLRGSFTHAGQTGGNRFRFTGRLRGRALRPGRYRLVGVPTDPAGNRGLPATRPFRILPRS